MKSGRIAVNAGEFWRQYLNHCGKHVIDEGLSRHCGRVGMYVNLLRNLYFDCKLI